MLRRRDFLTTAAAVTLFAVDLANALTRSSSDLKAGEFLWEPELSPDGPIVIVVSIPDQLVHVYRNGVEIAVSTCSTGKPGHTTPTGIFTILQKDKDHHSSTYNNAPMPNTERLTWSGIALHAGGLPGYPSSHGCVHLPKEFSAKLFGITHLGVPVIIADAKSQPTDVVHSGILLPPEAEEEAGKVMLAAAKQKHHPVAATVQRDDVVSVVISGADRKAAMMMDGSIAWESGITISDPDTPLGDHVYILKGVSADGSMLTFTSHGLGRVDSNVTNVSDPTLKRIQMENWQEAIPLLSKMRPGSVFVVTDLAADASTRSAPDFVVLLQGSV